MFRLNPLPGNKSVSGWSQTHNCNEIPAKPNNNVSNAQFPKQLQEIWSSDLIALTVTGWTKQVLHSLRHKHPRYYWKMSMAKFQTNPPTTPLSKDGHIKIKFNMYKWWWLLCTNDLTWHHHKDFGCLFLLHTSNHSKQQDLPFVKNGKNKGRE